MAKVNNKTKAYVIQFQFAKQEKITHYSTLASANELFGLLHILHKARYETFVQHIRFSIIPTIVGKNPISIVSAIAIATDCYHIPILAKMQYR